jgi:hypothetical protein
MLLIKAYILSAYIMPNGIKSVKIMLYMIIIPFKVVLLTSYEHWHFGKYPSELTCNVQLIKMRGWGYYLYFRHIYNLF